jgi:hypothetical protein
MKARTLLITIVLLAVVMVVIAGDPQKKLQTEKAYEIITGTWMNEEYSETERSYKYIIQPDGAYTGFTTASSGATYLGQITILDTMIDSEEFVWMKAKGYGVENQWKFYWFEIWKFSDSNMVWEVFSSTVEGWYGEGFPDNLEPFDHVQYTYQILYRQE